jgi:hypothetical protein
VKTCVGTNLEATETSVFAPILSHEKNTITGHETACNAGGNSISCPKHFSVSLGFEGSFCREEKNVIKSRLFVGAGLLGLSITADALANFSTVNGMRVQLRRFNDYPNSTLVVTPPPPNPPSNPQSYAVPGFPDVTFNEGPFGAGGFANQHQSRFSNTAGGADYLLEGTAGQHSNDAFDISIDVNLAVGSTQPRKEAGFRSDSFIAGESSFIITSDGEVAAFGGPIPFHSFGPSGSGAYVPGNTARMRIIYYPDNDSDAFDGDASQMEYIYDNNIADANPPVSSGIKVFSNLENGMIAGSNIGFYIQSAPNDSNPADFSNTAFRRIIAVPEPVCGSLVLAGVLGLARRRR